MTSLINRIHTFFFAPARNSHMNEAAILKSIICFHLRNAKRTLKNETVGVALSVFYTDLTTDLRCFFTSTAPEQDEWADDWDIVLQEAYESKTMDEEERTLMFKYFSSDLTLTRKEHYEASLNDIYYERKADEIGLCGFKEVEELMEEARPFREANKAFAAHIIDQLSKQKGSTPEYPTYFESHADVLLRYYAEEPLNEKEFEEAEYLSVEHHGLVAGMSYWSAEDSSICITNEFGKQIAAALTDIKTKAAHRLAAQNCIEPFVARNGLFCSPSTCAN